MAHIKQKMKPALPIAKDQVIEEWYLEYHDNQKNSHKFYEVIVVKQNNHKETYEVNIRHGKVGAIGRALQVRGGLSLEAARSLGESTAMAKKKGGYKQLNRKSLSIKISSAEDEESRFDNITLE